MGKKKLQGADGINFQMQLTIKGLETVTFPKETLTNESGKDIAWIECLGGKVSAYYRNTKLTACCGVIG